MVSPTVLLPLLLARVHEDYVYSGGSSWSCPVMLSRFLLFGSGPAIGDPTVLGPTEAGRRGDSMATVGTSGLASERL